jgi:hypothetical protein
MKEDTRPAMTKRTLKKADKPADIGDAPALIGKKDIKRSALEAWKKLDAVIQKELSQVLEGKKEITASTASAVIKFIEASAHLANGPEDLSPKDAEDRRQATMEKLYSKLPTFDDEDDEYSST